MEASKVVRSIIQRNTQISVLLSLIRRRQCNSANSPLKASVSFSSSSPLVNSPEKGLYIVLVWVAAEEVSSFLFIWDFGFEFNFRDSKWNFGPLKLCRVGFFSNSLPSNSVFRQDGLKCTQVLKLENCYPSLKPTHPTPLDIDEMSGHHEWLFEAISEFPPLSWAIGEKKT